MTTRPYLYRLLWPLNVPQYDLLTIASHCQLLRTLPVNFNALKLGVDLRMFELAKVLALGRAALVEIRSSAVPYCDSARVTSCRH